MDIIMYLNMQGEVITISIKPRLSFVRGKESMVHTVSACAKILRNPGNSDSYAKYHIYIH